MTNSVQTILREAAILIQEADNHSSDYDIAGLTTSLKDICNKLNFEFNEQVPNQEIIKDLKIKANKAGLRLEHQLHSKCNLFDYRYKLRKYAGQIFIDLKKLFNEEIKKTKTTAYDYNIPSETSTKIAEIGEVVNWSLRFVARSKCIGFVETEEDKQFIVKAVELLKEK